MSGSKIFAWNCGGLRRNTASTPLKVGFIEKSFGTDFDIFFFLETHHKDKNDIPNELLRYQNTHEIVQSEADQNETYSGIIGLIHKRYTITNSRNIIQGRILGISLYDNTSQSKYHISAVYLPTNQNLEKEYMQQVVRKLRVDEPDEVNYMVLGDFNFIDHPKDKKDGLNSKDKQISSIWIPFIEEMDMVDPFREQNAKRKVWSYTGKTGNSRIDRIYINANNIGNVTKIKYVLTPFHGHRVLSCNMQNNIEWGASYYKLNTSLFEEEEYHRIVEETVEEIESLTNRTYKQKWEVFMMSMKTKSITYSTKRNNTKKRVKNEIIRQIKKIEQENNPKHLMLHYEYLKTRLKEIEDKEIEGYIRRIKFLAPYEKSETDIAFYSKMENKKRSKDRIHQLAEEKDGKMHNDNENIIKIATKFYK